MTPRKHTVAKFLSAAQSVYGTDEYCRLPPPNKPGSRIAGLSRTGILELAKVVPGLVISLRREKARRGVRLLHLPTLMSHFQKLRESQSHLTPNADAAAASQIRKLT